jgi:hypothetical protein
MERMMIEQAIAQTPFRTKPSLLAAMNSLDKAILATTGTRR